MFDRVGGAEEPGEGSSIGVQTPARRYESFSRVRARVYPNVMVEVRAPAPTSALLTSRGRGRLLCLPSRDTFILRLSGPEQLPPKSRTVPGGGRLPKKLRGSCFCSALAQIPSLPAGCLPSPAHEGPAPSSGGGNGFFFPPLNYVLFSSADLQQKRRDTFGGRQEEAPASLLVYF